MAFEKQINPSLPITEPPCIHLRSKAMYVTGKVRPDHPDEAGSHYCWCNRTQHVIGPDKLDVDQTHCVPGRDCYCDSY